MFDQPCHLLPETGLDIPARTLKVEEDAWLIADDHGIMPWWGNRDITRPKIVYGAVVHDCAKVPRNDVGKMRSLAALRPGDGSHMLGPPPAWLTGHSDDGHIAKVDDFRVGLWRRTRLIRHIEALHLRC